MSGSPIAAVPGSVERSSGSALRLSLFAAAGLMLFAAGMLLWWSQGAAIFGEHLLSALAWCF